MPETSPDQPNGDPSSPDQPNRDRSSPGDPDGSAPRALRVVGALVLAEAAVLVGLALWSLVGLLTGGSTALGVALFLILFCLGVAAVLVASERALRVGRRGGRAPVVTWQLLQAATGLTIANASTGAISLAAWTALVVAVVVAVLMMTRGVVRHTVPRARPASQDGTGEGGERDG